jgi:hypothetical protein
VPPPPPPVELKPNQVRRTVALVVDDLGLSFASIAQLRSALKKFVDERMEPDDLVAILRTGAGMGALQQFTADNRMLYAAIDRVRYNALGRVGVASFPPFQAVGTYVDTPVADEERQTDFSVGTIGALRHVVDGLASCQDASRSSSSPRTCGSSPARARTTASWRRCAAWLMPPTAPWW